MDSIYKKNKKGFSLVEILLYIAIVTVVMFAVINIVLVVSKSIKRAEAYNSIKNSAISVLEKITKEVRFATGIDLNNSIFNSSNGVLVLNTLDESGFPEVTRFYSNNGLIKMDINGGYSRTVTYGDTKVLDLIFMPIITNNSQSIKIEMTMSGGEENSLISEKFYSTVVLRNSYLK